MKDRLEPTVPSEGQEPFQGPKQLKAFLLHQAQVPKFALANTPLSALGKGMTGVLAKVAGALPEGEATPASQPAIPPGLFKTLEAEFPRAQPEPAQPAERKAPEGDLAKAFVDFFDSGELDLALSSRYRYKGVALEVLAYTGGHPPSLEESRRYLAHLREEKDPEKKLSPSTLKVQKAALVHWHKAQRETLEFRIKVPERLPPYYSRQLVEDFLEGGRAISPQAYCGICLLGWGGLRRREASQPIQVFTDRKVMRFIGKGGKEREVPTLPPLEEAMPPFLKDGYLELGLSYKKVYTLVKDLGEKTKHPEVSPKSFRTFFATYMLDIGVDPKRVQQVMGHSDIQTTFEYYKALRPEAVAEVRDRFLRAEGLERPRRDSNPRSRP